MEKLISELPIELRELALLRQRESKSSNISDSKTSDKLTRAFDWDRTPEGISFWNEVYCGKDVTDYSCYPKNKSKELSKEELLTKAIKDHLLSEKPPLSFLTKNVEPEKKPLYEWAKSSEPKSLKYSDLKPGDYFVDGINPNVYGYINKYVSDDLCYYINKDKLFEKSNEKFTCFDEPCYLRMADFSERLWLDKCIEAGKFIDKEEALKPEVKESIESKVKDLSSWFGENKLEAKEGSLVSACFGFTNFPKHRTGSVNIYRTGGGDNHLRSFHDTWKYTGNAICDTLKNWPLTDKDVFKKDALQFQAPVIIKSKNTRKSKLIIINN